MKKLVLLLALCLSLLAVNASANTFDFSIIGTDPLVFGSGSATFTHEGPGVNLVTALTGNLSVDGIGGVISLVPYGGTPGTWGTDPSGLYYYDDLAFKPPSLPVDFYGLVFNVVGFDKPLNLYSDNGQLLLIDNVGGSYNYYPVSVNATPEPSTFLLFSTYLFGAGLFGLLGLRKKFA
jgi:hypothetical protein